MRSGACCVPGPGRCTGLGLSLVSCGPVELRAWLCAFVLAFDALRGVLDRRFSKLSRSNGFHLDDLLHTQYFQFLMIFYSYLKKERKRESRKRIKRDFVVLTRTCRSEWYLHHPGTCLASQAFIFWICAVPTRTVRGTCPVHLLFSTSPGLAALLRSDGSSPGPCASSGGRLPQALFVVFRMDSKGTS